jgi:uncharacterized RDD family membrane protein YckC
MTEDLYRAPQAELIDPAVRSAELAPRGTRLIATIADQLLVLPTLIPLFIGVGLHAENEVAFSPGVMPWAAVTVLLMIGLLVVNCVLMARDGQTIGKRWLGIRVVRSDGSHLSFGRWLGLRVVPIYLLSQIPVFGFFVALADPLAIFRDTYKCLHDDLADTIVVTA